MRISTIGIPAVCWLILGFQTGCGSKPQTEGPIVANSASEFVNKSFLGKPLGASASKFKPDSAKATGDKIQIQDLAGKKYEVTVSGSPGSNSYKISEPQPVK